MDDFTDFTDLEEYDYSVGEFAYFFNKGEIVKITKKQINSNNDPELGDTLYTIESLNDYDPVTGEPSQRYKCGKYSLCPILDDNVQLMLRMVFNSKKFTILKNLR